MQNSINYFNRELYCEKVSIKKIAKEVGTPFYIMSSENIRNQYSYFEEVFSSLDHLTCYAIKANYNLSVIRFLAKLGSGADVGSKGELFRALKAGVDPKKIVMSGVGKNIEDIEYAIKNKILMLNIESISELILINEVAKKFNRIVCVGIRINPSVIAPTHSHLATGGHNHKFGIDEKYIFKIIDLLRTLKYVKIIGLNVQIGSEIQSPAPYLKVIKKIILIKKNFEVAGFNIKYLDLGGGFPVSYDETKPQKELKIFADAIIPLLKKSGAQIIFEPGRYLVANAGILITKVLFLKENSSKKRFVIVDAGMSELIRPVLYGAYHHILPIIYSKKSIKADIVGPICESGDFFAKNRKISLVKENDFLAILSTGAYGSVMGSNYNGRLRPPEILVSGKNFKIIRKKETLNQFIKNEI